MKRGLSLVLSVLLVLGLVMGGGMQAPVWAQPENDPPPTLTAPATPTGLKATAVDHQQIDLTWSSSEGAAGYRLYQDSKEIYDGAATNFSHVGLAANTAYSYTVLAFNEAGESPLSSVVYQTTKTAPVEPPAAPTNLAASAQSATSIRLTWTKGSGTVDYYSIERKTSGGSYSEIQPNISSGSTSFDDSSLSANTTYYYRIRAFNSGGPSPYSNEANAATQQAATIPAQPTNLAVTSVSANSVTLTWQDKSNNETGFKIERKTGSGSYSEITTVSANTTSFTNTGLSNNTIYTYRVRAYNAAGNSAYSNEISAKTGVVLARPENLETSSISTDRVTLTWRDRSSNEKGFIIERKTGTGSFVEIERTRANITSYTDTRLKNNTTYTYRIQAYNDDGRSDFSEELKITTGTVPSKPEDLKITSVSTDRIRIEWRDRSDNETGFRIERRTGNGSFTEIDTVRANVTTYTNTGLRNRTEYTYRVRAYNDTGNSAYSNEVSAVTGLVPDAPDRLTVTGTEKDRATLSWRDRSDNENGFILERKTGTGNFTKVATLSANTTSYTDRDLTSGQRYTYRVKAYNDSGASGASNELVVQIRQEIVTRLTIGSTQYRVDGQLKQMDAAPVIVESRTLLPIRYVAEAIGATVLWDAQAQKVTVLLDD
ncbi:MAG: fibronectin type III domain-containing protein, partial [Bacillota bacterium]|nr:fibronectin type III domain-containing protein [Bacillota bacterium]